MFTNEDAQLIEKLGLDSLTEEQQAASLAQFYETIRISTGMALEDKLTDEQLMTFAEVQGANDDAATEAWVRRTIPDYDAIVAAESESVLNDVMQSRADVRRAVSDK